MNFLLYMLGRAGRFAPGFTGDRPGPRRMLLANAATRAAQGDLDAALAIYQRLGRTSRLSPMDLLIRGHLHLAVHNDRAAHRDLAHGADRLLSRDSHESQD